MNTAAAGGGTVPLSPSFFVADPAGSVDALNSSRKRKTSDAEEFSLAFLQSPPLSAENSTNGTAGNNGNGTLTARAEGGGLRIKIRRTTPKGGTPLAAAAAATLPPNNFSTVNLNTQPTMLTQQFPQMMPPLANNFMMNPMGMPMPPLPFPNPMITQMSFPPGLGMPPPPQTLALAPQNSLLVNDSTELGPPPTAPPRMAVEHSLMGGGIELQPVRSVDTRNFDWNRRTSTLETTEEEDESSGRPRSESLPNLSSGLLDGLTLNSESSFFKEV
ncbi:unnamed protein product [Aphanomyces euteiches]|uniref:Uncharacterized protein n=1 Tax=Aphanomyces euteiches TaxID=100861 RepID=A0A6G0XWC9_9STRA|nr:hypothetical protein Ae201684_000601 [Aphanomyces euteiches]KAH9091874.1 hypothetical protein Ae201684P_011417 [Aphanomyces euteiches]KAH9155827.1 hypothetical protein AeRB84_002214 [Aphanomyces euteiches]